MFLASSWIYKSANDHDLHFSLYRKSGDNSIQPVVLIFKGGGWKYETDTKIPEFHEETMKELMELGFSIVVFEYRVVSTKEVYFPQIIQDCRDLLIYMYNNRNLLRLDLNNILFCGHSAGAQLAFLLAFGSKEYNMYVLPGQFNVRALVLTNMPFYLYKKTLKEGYTTKEVPYLFKNCCTKELREISPITFVSNIDKPLLLVCSKNDTMGSDVQADDFLEKCPKQNKNCLYLSISGVDHDFNTKEQSIESREELIQIQNSILDFVSNYLK